MSTQTRLFLALILACSAALVGCSSPAPQLTERQEYFAGRAMAAETLDTAARVVADETTIEYVNLLGLTLARSSGRPSTFADYTFIVIDSENVNAYALPGGFIFVTSALIFDCQTEDELAGVLAHEISHVVRKHPELAVAKAKSDAESSGATFGFLKNIAANVGANVEGVDSEELLAAVAALEKVSEVVLEEVKNGYSRDQELEADRDGARLMTKVGYDPQALRAFVVRLKQRVEAPGGQGWSSDTHPHPADRVSDIDKVITNRGLAGKVDETRTTRFKEIKRSLKAWLDDSANAPTGGEE